MVPKSNTAETECLENTSAENLIQKDQCNIDIEKNESDKVLNRETKVGIPDRIEEKNQNSQYDEPKKIQKHYPYFTFTICLVQIIIYLKSDCVQINSLCYSPKYRSQLWRLLTYSLLHANLCHLILNQMNLVLFGLTFEMEHGSLKAFIIYTTGSIAGALGFDFFDRTQRMIGASGACSAFLMAQFSYHILNWKAIKYWKYRNAVVTSFVISDIISGPISHFIKLEQNLSWVSHMSAGINGFILGLLILDSKNQKILVKLRCFFAALYVMIAELLIIQYVPFIMDALYRHSKRYNY